MSHSRSGHIDKRGGSLEGAVVGGKMDGERDGVARVKHSEVNCGAKRSQIGDKRTQIRINSMGCQGAG